jgi:hypothetical protein
MHRKRDLERARREHDRNVDADSPHRVPEEYVRSRLTDRGIWAKLSYLVDRYSAAILGAIIGFLTWLGFSVRTPAQKVDDLRAEFRAATSRIDSRVDTVSKRVDTLTQAQAEWRADVQASVNALIKLYCYDATIPQRDKRLSGIVKSNGECLK